MSPGAIAFSQVILTAPRAGAPLALGFPGHRGGPAPGSGRCLSLVIRGRRTALPAADADNENATDSAAVMATDGSRA